jgi:hypothetical protein
MHNFKKWFAFNEQMSEYEKVKNYVTHLVSDPPVRLDDFETAVRLVKNAVAKSDPEGEFNLWSDYNPLLMQIMQQLPEEEHPQAKSILMKRFPTGKIARSMAVKGMTEPTMNLDDFTQLLDRAMHDGEFGIPQLQYFIDKNKSLWNEVPEEKRQEFLDWMMKKLREMKDQPTLAQMLKQVFDKLEGEDS